MTEFNNRQQRCIELYDRLKAQFLRTAVLNNLISGVQPTKKSDTYYRYVAAHDAAVLITLLSRLTAHQTIKDFKAHCVSLSDYIYQDEIPDDG